MDPSLKDSVKDNLNKRFSKFSFVPSYLTPSPTTFSDDQENKHAKVATESRPSSAISTGLVKHQKHQSPMEKESLPRKDTTPALHLDPTNANLHSVTKADRLKDRVETTSESLQPKPSHSDGGKEPSRSLLPISRILRKPISKISFETTGPPSEDIPNTVVQSPNAPAFAHVHEEPRSPRVEKALRVPFLQKFRRSRELKDLPILDPHDDIPHGQSFFEHPSTDRENEEGAEKGAVDLPDDKSPVFLGNAHQASFRRPVMVECRRSSHSPELGLKDILSRGPSTKEVAEVSPISDEQNSMLEPTSMNEEQRRKEVRRSALIGWPTPEEVPDGPQTASSMGVESFTKDDDRVSSLCSRDAEALTNPASAPLRLASEERAGSLGLAFNGLRSHPMSAKSKPPKRQVTFPLSIQANKHRTWEREDVISTPYPSKFLTNHENGWKKQETANLTVILYGPPQRPARIKYIHVPSTAHEIPIRNSSTGEMVIKNRYFDDFALAKALFTAYKTMRGAFLVRYGARTIRSFKLLGYDNNCQLSQKRARQQCFKVKDEDDGFVQDRLMELYREPSLGKGKWVWWAWVKGLPENQKGDEPIDDIVGGKVALELVEGWSLKRLAIALATVVLCCVLATVIWISSGVHQVSSSGQAEVTTDSIDRTVIVSNQSPSTPLPDPSPTEGIASIATHASYPSISTIPGVTIAGPGSGLPPGAIVSAPVGVPDQAAGIGTVTPSVVVRDAQSPDTWTTSIPRETSTSTAALGRQSTQPETYHGEAGSRVGSGVGLGALVLLLGLIIIAVWMAASYFT